MKIEFAQAFTRGTPLQKEHAMVAWVKIQGLYNGETKEAGDPLP
jgi:hypothetical protein